jgi:hypothetical protein
MDDKIIAIFCLCDDLLKAMHHQEDRQCQMNDAEIMTGVGKEVCNLIMVNPRQSRGTPKV